MKFSCTDTLSLRELRLVDLLFESHFALALSTIVPSSFAGEWDGGLLDTGISCFKTAAGDADRKFNDTLFDDLQIY